MYKDGKFVGFGTLCCNLYRFDLFSNDLNCYINYVATLVVAFKRPSDNHSKMAFL